jgi:hypothetical protein
VLLTLVRGVTGEAALRLFPPVSNTPQLGEFPPGGWYGPCFVTSSGHRAASLPRTFHSGRCPEATTQRGTMAIPPAAPLGSWGRPSCLDAMRRKCSALPSSPFEGDGPPPLGGLPPRIVRVRLACCLFYAPHSGLRSGDAHPGRLPDAVTTLPRAPRGSSLRALTVALLPTRHRRRLTTPRIGGYRQGRTELGQFP